MEKPAHLWGLCRNRPEYFESWESRDHLQEWPGAGAAEAAGEFPCVHRGPARRGEGCKACGQRDVTALVQWCAIHGECTVHSHGLRRVGGRIETCVGCQRRQAPELQDLVIDDGLCLGDVVVLAAAVCELQSQYPGRFRITIRSNHSYLWEADPTVTAIGLTDENLPEKCVKISAHYDGETAYSRPDVYATINASNQRPIHFLEAYCEGLSAALGLPPLRPKQWLEPVIRLSDTEKGWFSQVRDELGWVVDRPFWIVNAGCKSDYTAKQWHGFEEVVWNTRDDINWVQIGAAADNHKPIEGVALNLVGRTDGRQLVRLVYHARGVLCGVTALAHLAHWVETRHAMPRAAVVIGGGRESPHWYAYPGQHAFHTIGQISCCKSGGCWKSRTVPLGDGSENDKSQCVNPSGGVPLCMRLVSPSDVIRSILQLNWRAE